MSRQWWMSQLQRWMAQPAGFSVREGWYYNGSLLGYTGAWLVHMLYIGLFWYWNIPVLAWFNLLSVAMWAAAIMLLRRRRLAAGLLVGLVEQAVHAFLAVRYVGWDFGAQYYFFVVTLAVSLLRWPIWGNLAFIGVWGLVFWVLSMYAQFYPPLAQPDPLQLSLVGLFNTVGAFLLAGTTAVYFATIAEQADDAFRSEHERSEALLYNVLPGPIAGRLKAGEEPIADSFEGASVLFADIVDFTRLSQHISPQQLVLMLGDVFSLFDELVGRYGLEKIKTVGDAYMVAAGIPTPRGDHAGALAELALEMRQAWQAYNRRTGSSLRLRVGISSGPVVAGVIGKQRFLYDLWGDSVNTASRMESHGVADEIQVSESSWALLRDEYVFEPRGLVDVKGKGPMMTYFLKGRR